jgi:hypothetical protein
MQTAAKHNKDSIFTLSKKYTKQNKQKKNKQKKQKNKNKNQNDKAQIIN